MLNDKTVVLNGGRINYDGNAGYDDIASEVTVYEDSSEEEILERVQGYSVVVTKEIPVPGHIIEGFPNSVKLICEAGTGYNNIDLEAARKKVAKLFHFEEVLEAVAGSVITGHCGRNTLGVLFIAGQGEGV